MKSRGRKRNKPAFKATFVKLLICVLEVPPRGGGRAAACLKLVSNLELNELV